MRIFELALIASLAFAQEEMATEETQAEAAEEEVDETIYKNWSGDVQWVDLKTQENPGSKQFSSNTESDPNPAWIQLPTTIAMNIDEAGAASVSMTMTTGWDLQFQDAKNAKCCSGSYAGLGWAWQNADGMWETAVSGMTRGNDAIEFSWSEGMSTSVDNKDLRQKGTAAWGDVTDGAPASWTVTGQEAFKEQVKKVAQVTGMTVSATRPAQSDASTVAFQNLQTYKLCGIGFLNRNNDVGASQEGCADFMFNMPVKPEPEPVEEVVEEEMFATRLTSAAFAIAALFALNF